MANSNLMVQLKDSRLPNTTFSNRDELLYVMRLYMDTSTQSVPRFQLHNKSKSEVIYYL